MNLSGTTRRDRLTLRARKREQDRLAQRRHRARVAERDRVAAVRSMAGEMVNRRRGS